MKDDRIKNTVLSSITLRGDQSDAGYPIRKYESAEAPGLHISCTVRWKRRKKEGGGLGRSNYKRR